jgi:hypothetical protein
MKMTLRFYCSLMAGLVLAGTLVSCGSDNDRSSSSSTLSSLPESTGPVSSTALIAGLLGGKVVQNLATTGQSLNSLSFSSGQSLPFCENANIIKSILSEMAQPDKILCYMGKMESNGLMSGISNVADGQFHYMKLLNMGGGGSNSEPTIKFKIAKTGSSISSFVMYSCFSGTTSAPTQSEFISQTFTGADLSSATIISKNIGSSTESGTTSSYGSSVTVTGTYSFTTGEWTSAKSITANRYYAQTGTYTGNYAMTLTGTEYADTFRASVAMNGGFGSDTYSNRFYTVMQLIRGDSIADLAFGDGASNYVMSYDQNNDGADFTDTNTAAWDGDTKAVGTYSSSSYKSLVDAGTVPSAPSTGSVTFTGDEAWDCSLPSGESWVSINFTASTEASIMTCEDEFISQSWVSCPY